MPHLRSWLACAAAALVLAGCSTPGENRPGPSALQTTSRGAVAEPQARTKTRAVEPAPIVAPQVIQTAPSPKTSIPESASAARTVRPSGQTVPEAPVAPPAATRSATNAAPLAPPTAPAQAAAPPRATEAGPVFTTIVDSEEVPPSFPPPMEADESEEASQSHVSAADWVDMLRWNAAASGIVLSVSASQQCRLRSAQGSFYFWPKTRTAYWNGEIVMLSFSPQWTKNRPYLNRLDLENTILPLLRRPLSMSLAGKVLVIDPGHGGSQPGTLSVVGNHSEKDLTLDWALRTRALLTNQGWTVYLTRTNDNYVGLTNRVAFAEHCHASLFVSLHFNSVKNDSKCSGMETYCMTPPGMPSHNTRGSESPDVQPNNAFDEDNLRWAVRLHGELARRVKMEDRGVRRARFMGVLRTQKCPAVLIEGGYLSNPAEASKIITPAYRQHLAEALAKALANP